MARHKEFDMDVAIYKATDLFWQRGYERTSLNDLLEHLGIGRASFYNAFGDKRALFMEVLRRYQTQINDAVIIQTLEEADSGLEGIDSVFSKIIESLTQDVQHRGCLLVNSAVDVAPVDKDVAALISESIYRCEEAFYRALNRAQETGELSPGLDLWATACFLMNTLRGMRLTGRTTHERRIFEDIARIALSVLRS